MVIIQFRYLYLLSIRQNVTTSLPRRYPTSLWSCHIVAMETSGDVATLLQRLIMTSLYETWKWRRFCNVAQRFHRNYMATSERRWIATSQQRCNDVFVSTGFIFQFIKKTKWHFGYTDSQVIRACEMWKRWACSKQCNGCSSKITFLYMWFLKLSCKNNLAAEKKWRVVVVLEIHRKLTSGSPFWNVGGCKTQIQLKSLRRTILQKLAF